MNKKLNSISSKRKASRSSLIISTPAVSSNYSSNPMGGGINGFTIIEVALVLAIAGLIFLVVFIAWPALQNSQRDQAIRQDVGRVASALEQYKVDNQGNLPPSPAGLVWWRSSWGSGYVGRLNAADHVWIAPVGTAYNVGTYGTTAIVVFEGIRCPKDTGASPAGSSNAAVNAPLTSGQGYCVSI